MKKVFLFLLFSSACNDSIPSIPADFSIDNQEINLWKTPPRFESLSEDIAPVFDPLYNQLTGLSEGTTASLTTQIDALFQEAITMKENQFPKELQTPQVMSRFVVFQTRIGILKKQQPTALDLINLEIAWNTFVSYANNTITLEKQEVLLDF